MQAEAGRRSGANKIAGEKARMARDIRDLRGNVEHHVGGVLLLHGLVVDPERHLQIVGVANLTCRRQERADRQKAGGECH